MRLVRIACFAVICAGSVAPSSAQNIELTGSRALGMGGAFVAVASDASATWWNPAGLAAGPFLDLSLARASTGFEDSLPAWRHGGASFALATPPLGVSYYRFRLTDIRPFDPTGGSAGDREERRAGVPARSLSASQLGVTLVQTLVTGVHAGATLKYVRGAFRTGRDDGLLAPGALLDRAEDLEGGGTQGRFDLDVGVIGIAGSLRLGAVVRNMRQPEFDSGGQLPEVPDIRLPRQVRVGAAFDPERATGVPLTVAFDADLRAYDTGTGQRRVVAAGVEHWFLARRFGVRTGGRFNTTGGRERAATVGATVAVRSGLFVEGHLVGGGSAGESGWGLAARVSF